MKRIERLFPVVFLLMLIGGLFSCNENEDIEVEKKPDTIQTEYGEVIISADYVPIDWNKSANQVLSIEVPNEKEAVVTMALEDKKKASEIQKGSIITVDVDTAIYLRKVTSVTVDGNKVTAVTTQGTLEDVFDGSEFELSMGEEPDCELYTCDVGEDCITPEEMEEDEDEDEFFPYDDESNDAIMNAPWRRKSAAVSTPKSTVRKLERTNKKLPRFYPTEIRGYDENGQWTRQSYESFTRGDDDKPGQLDINIPLNIDLHSKSDDGFTVGVEGDATFNTKLGFRMTTNYPDGSFVSTYKKGNVVIEPVFFFTPKLIYSLRMYLRYTAASSGSDGKPKKPIFEPKKIAQGPTKKIVFMVGVVPVELTPDVGLFAHPELTFTAEADVTFSGQLYTDSDYELGIRWEQKKKKFSQIFNKPAWQNKFSPPTVGINGTIEGRMYIYPQCTVKLYDIVGPYIAYKPYVGLTLSGGVNTSTGLTWKAKVGVGSMLVPGLRAEAVGYELMNKELAQVKLGKELTLFEAPAELDSNSGDKIKVGQANDIEVQVQDILLFTQINTLLPCNVLFYTENNEKEILDDTSTSSSDFHYRVTLPATKGKVKVQWVPKSKNSALTAAIYEPNGEMMEFIIFRPDNAPAGVEGIDMGTGLLWASMNIGAEDEEGVGDLVGWGDASGKHEQQSFEASYGNYVEDIEECMKYYGGTSPHSNIAGTKYDYATNKWGGQWRMPTWKEWDKLIKTCEISYEKKEFGEYYVFTSPEGKKLYFPAGGYALGGGENEFWSGYDTVTGEYWTSILNSKKKNEAWYVGMSRKSGKNKVAAGSVPRYYRQSVRAVRPKK